MKRFTLIVGYLGAFSILAAITYGFYLLHPGLGWIVGGFFALAQALYYGPEARAKRAAKAKVDVTNHVFLDGKPISQAHREVN